MTQPDVVLQTVSLGAQWPTMDPFLFCAHHDDLYPAGTAELGPDASLDGRSIGSDFAQKDGWNMYHGSVVPGFPQHPHRGFETVSFVRHGLIDHADSMGAHARFGRGDVQWMTAGRGVVHSEMFPLLDQTSSNRMQMFQIWMNLPAEDKMVDPHFAMLWSETIPIQSVTDQQGRTADITVIAGSFGDATAPPPAPKSWAARAEADVAILHLRLDAGASVELPAVGDGVGRVLYLFEGTDLTVSAADASAATLPGQTGAVLAPETAVSVTAGGHPVEAMVLQGRPIGEPVEQHGPFVMNTRAEIQQAFDDYQRTQFGGWPWPTPDPNHGHQRGRFAQHADGTVEEMSPV